MTLAFICMYGEKIAGCGLSHHSSAHGPMPCSRHQGQWADSLTIPFVILPPSNGGGGRNKKKKKSHYLYLSFPLPRRKCKRGRDSCHELFIFYPEEDVSFLAYRDFLFGKKKYPF